MTTQYMSQKLLRNLLSIEIDKINTKKQGKEININKKIKQGSPVQKLRTGMNGKTSKQNLAFSADHKIGQPKLKQGNCKMCAKKTTQKYAQLKKFKDISQEDAGREKDENEPIRRLQPIRQTQKSRIINQKRNWN